MSRVRSPGLTTTGKPRRWASAFFEPPTAPSPLDNPRCARIRLVVLRPHQRASQIDGLHPRLRPGTVPLQVERRKYCRVLGNNSSTRTVTVRIDASRETAPTTMNGRYAMCSATVPIHTHRIRRRRRYAQTTTNNTNRIHLPTDIDALTSMKMEEAKRHTAKAHTKSGTRRQWTSQRRRTAGNLSETQLLSWRFPFEFKALSYSAADAAQFRAMTSPPSAAPCGPDSMSSAFSAQESQPPFLHACTTGFVPYFA